MQRLVFVALLTLAAICTNAQDKPRVDKVVFSPEVHPDHSVTFRFFAPNAKGVAVEREGAKRLSMTLGDKGVWSLTTSSLDPDFYVYSFVVDKQQVADPANPLHKSIVTGGTESILHVPGSLDLAWEDNDVPHGVIHQHFIRSQIIGEDRSFFVYTPPNYKRQSKYPVLILLHGVMDDETTWITTGRANVILDNLIDRHQAKPMILVIPLGYGLPNAPDHVGDLFAFSTDQQKIMDVFEKHLSDEILTEVRRNYHVDEKNIAVAGASMGGAQALYFGLNHPNRFSAIGAFSPAVVMYPALQKFFPALDATAINKLKPLEIDCGKQDFLYKPVQSYRTWLKSKGVNFMPTDTPGEHNWLVWRRNLIDFAPKLFR